MTAFCLYLAVSLSLVKATRRRVNLAWTFFLQLLRGESVAMNGDPGPVIVMSDLASQMPSLTNLKTPVSSAGFELTLPCRNFKDDSQHKKQLSSLADCLDALPFPGEDV